ncbi:DNA-binding protein [Candidatus Thiomargarita nelsonii]|uniref:DNA-binding protein n=1 Tax=Candidatus Thiomargarita nelsonii TaxID=1003181 RepID=A0A4E0RNX7_9GAMM|nr:DNA-binding protein [Candidatus Thiomargarita nelsonii]
MSKEKHYKSEAFAAIHETMDSLHQIGAIDKKTMRDFDAACIENVSEPIKPEEIKALRETAHVSQLVFALYFNVSKNLISDWERGKKKPSGPAQRLLSIVQKQGLDALV